MKVGEKTAWRGKEFMLSPCLVPVKVKEWKVCASLLTNGMCSGKICSLSSV